MKDFLVLLEIDPIFMILSGGYVPWSKKISIIHSDIVARNDKNLKTYLKLRISRVIENDVKFIFHPKYNSSFIVIELKRKF